VKTRLRLAAVPFLSARPLIYGIESGVLANELDLTVDSPQDCVSLLTSGAADLALLPTVCLRTLLLDPGLDLRIVPGVAAVRTTSLHASDDEPLLGPLPGSVSDWCEQHGLPFVSALWVGRNGAAGWQHAELLAQSRDFGLAHLPDIAAAQAKHKAGFAARYQAFLASSMTYRLGAQELSGLAALLDQLGRAEGSMVSARPRFLDLAYPSTGETAAARPRRERGGAAKSLDTLLAATAAGERLAPDQALRLYTKAPLLDLGRAADERRQGLHPGNIVTYIIDRNVNYTNLCVTACKFCNFFRPRKSHEAHTLSRLELAHKFSETVAMGGVQILLQGGVNPDLPLTYYEDLFRWTKSNFPLALHALSPEEISFISRMENLPIRRVLERLVAAGLDSVPGGGAEILDDEIRRRISPLKCSTDTWLAVMREAHGLGLRTTATMVFGFGETPEHIVAHLDKLRALQDRTSGFTAFICWPFQAEGTRMRLADDTTASRYLRVFALSRLYLDNFPNLQVSWPTMGPAIGQVALRFGGNDFGSAMIEENVVSQAGAVWMLSAEDIERQVRAAGFVPRRRNMRYELLDHPVAPPSPTHTPPERRPATSAPAGAVSPTSPSTPARSLW
jgi:cyclic dehypoxanthinyl futalosine synthase